jgi:hypothetical protein
LDNISVADRVNENTEYFTYDYTVADYVRICAQTIYVQNQSELTITGNLTMNNLSSIVIEDGSEMTIDGGQVYHTNVLVESGGKLTIENGGKLVLKNNELNIEDGGILDISEGDIQIVDE